jgi:hypothetical protein
MRTLQSHSSLTMILNPRVWYPVTGVAALAIMGCQPHPAAAPPEQCGSAVPETAQHPVSMPAADLAGDYRLVQVRTQPAPSVTTSGRLHLMPVDSATRAAAVGGAVRELTGWLDPMDGDSLWRADAGSRDPAHPGAVLAGSHLRLGQSGSLDAYVEHLTITAVSRDGFWGWWKAEPGFELTLDSASGRRLPDPAGFFCALRVHS